MWILFAFLLGVLVARLAGWWFVLRLIGLTAWMAGCVIVIHAENTRLQQALDAERARESEALRLAKMVSQIGSRRLS